MSALLAGPMTISMDEPCYLLEERIEPGKGGYRRVQRFTVVRPDGDGNAALTKCQVDLGPETAFAYPQFDILGGVREYVARKCRTCRGQRRLKIPEMPRWLWPKCTACGGSGTVEGGRITILETVGTMVDQANARRGGLVDVPDYAPTDLHTAWRAQAEQKRDARVGRVRFGDLHLEKRETWTQS
jgi:hypothetical protein